MNFKNLQKIFIGMKENGFRDTTKSGPWMIKGQGITEYHQPNYEVYYKKQIVVTCVNGEIEVIRHINGMDENQLYNILKNE